MKKHPRTPLAARALVAGFVMIGLAACQPVATVPTGNSGSSTGAGTGNSAATPTLPLIRTTK